MRFFTFRKNIFYKTINRYNRSKQQENYEVLKKKWDFHFNELTCCCPNEQFGQSGNL